MLVVGIDGVRWDRLSEAATPALDSVAAQGFIRPVRVHGSGPTLSGPCWATIATGTRVAVHGIVDNSTPCPPGREPPPDFLARARDAGLQTYAAAGWPALLRPVECGPIFSPAGATMVPPDPGSDPAAWDAADQLVADDAARVLAAGGVAAAFVYLGAADEAAHAAGVGAAYRAAIEACDRRLAILLRSVGAPGPGRGWTIIVVTDHGHRDAGGHGGDTDAERTAWIAACGPDIPGDAPDLLEQADVHAQVLATLGIPLGAADDGFATPFGRRTGSDGHELRPQPA